MYGFIARSSYLSKDSNSKKLLYQRYSRTITRNLEIKSKAIIVNNQIKKAGILNAYSNLEVKRKLLWVMIKSGTHNHILNIFNQPKYLNGNYYQFVKNTCF